MELIVILVIALLLLGPKKLPDVGRSVGKGMREFKNAISGNDTERDAEAHGALPEPRDPGRVRVSSEPGS